MEEIQLFWSQIIPPLTTVDLKSEDDSYIKITSACIPDNPPHSGSVKIEFHVKIPTEFYEEGNEMEAEFQEINVFAASLVPSQQEQQTLNFRFSPLEMVQITNHSDIEVHLSGYYIPIDDYTLLVEEEEEEEENDEGTNSSNLTPDEIQNRFKGMISKQKPPPTNPQAKHKH